MYIIKQIEFLEPIYGASEVLYPIKPIGNITMSITEYKKPNGSFYLAVMNIDDSECRDDGTAELVYKFDMLTTSIVWLQSMVNEYVESFLIHESEVR